MLVSLNCLRESNVRGCEGLTNASMVSMFKSSKQLEIVDLVDCDGIEAEAVELFVLNCLRLRHICVEESKFSDVSRSWASKKIIELRQIHVEESKLSDVSRSWASKKFIELNTEQRDREREMDSILCDELLEEVLRRLPRRSTFSSSTADVSLVSKRWLRLYRSSVTDVSLSLSVDNCTPPSLSSFLSHFPHLSSLKINIIGQIRAPHDTWNFSDRLLSSVASSCPPELTHLCLQRMPVSPSLLLSLSTSCPHLTSLSITLSRPLSFHWLLSFPSLQQLDLVFVSHPTKFDIVDAASKGNNLDGELKLETLNIYGIRCSDYGLNGLWKSCKKLKKLQLLGCHGVGSFNNCLKGLQELTMIACNLVPGFFTTIGHSVRNLWKLELNCIDKLADEEFTSMLAWCNCLRELKVMGCKGLTNASVVSMFKS
ncbi:hypothetical protein RHGRI_022829 [Rhododendron griersonianum]|uniref:F-box/LRR-repeat protein n=1 Tax=Rhododendron griersonianum TaxID=479676 RepID=A0AAV6J5F0_9ERIC|nr:hypothetical protein RHGRI_022829 [Rhododendron griersonianum]